MVAGLVYSKEEGVSRIDSVVLIVVFLLNIFFFLKWIYLLSNIYEQKCIITRFVRKFIRFLIIINIYLGSYFWMKILRKKYQREIKIKEKRLIYKTEDELIKDWYKENCKSNVIIHVFSIINFWFVLLKI